MDFFNSNYYSVTFVKLHECIAYKKYGSGLIFNLLVQTPLEVHQNHNFACSLCLFARARALVRIWEEKLLREKLSLSLSLSRLWLFMSKGIQLTGACR